MKVVHVIESCFPGGAEVFVKGLIIELNKLGVETELWLLTAASLFSNPEQKRIDFEQQFIHELNTAGIEIRHINKRPHKDWSKASKRIRELCRTRKPDIIHTHLENVTFHVVRSFVNQSAQILQTIHSTKIHHPFIQCYFIPWFLAGSISISEKVSKVVQNQCKALTKNNQIIHNGIDLDLFASKNRFSGNPVQRIISIGRLTPAKDHFTLIQSYRSLVDRLISNHENVPMLQIVGEGELRKELRNLVQTLNLSEFVCFEGIKSNIPQLLEESDIYVMSSAWEGLSISLIEALASGIPILATNVGSNNEIIDDQVNGILIPPKNPLVMADRLYELIHDSKLRITLSRNCHNKAQHFSIETCAKQHVKLYKNVTSI